VITGLYTILLPIVAFGFLASSRHLVVGGDSATAAIMYAGIAALGIAGLQPGSDQWVGLASLSALREVADDCHAEGRGFESHQPLRKSLQVAMCARRRSTSTPPMAQGIGAPSLRPPVGELGANFRQPVQRPRRPQPR
jgi:hypothetical protein